MAASLGHIFFVKKLSTPKTVTINYYADAINKTIGIFIKSNEKLQEGLKDWRDITNLQFVFFENEPITDSYDALEEWNPLKIR